MKCQLVIIGSSKLYPSVTANKPKQCFDDQQLKCNVMKENRWISCVALRVILFLMS